MPKDSLTGIKIYYLTFEVETLVPVTETNIRAPLSEISQYTTPQQYTWIQAHLSRKCSPATFFEESVRLLIEHEQSKSVILLNQDGCVKTGRQLYYLKPGDFLRLRSILEEIRNKKEMMDKHRHRSQR